MKTVTYRIYQTDDTGSFNIDALANSVGGVWHNTADVGDQTVGFITLEAENAAYLEELLEEDENVTAYDVHSEQEQEILSNPFRRGK